MERRNSGGRRGNWGNFLERGSLEERVLERRVRVVLCGSLGRVEPLVLVLILGVLAGLIMVVDGGERDG